MPDRKPNRCAISIKNSKRLLAVFLLSFFSFLCLPNIASATCCKCLISTGQSRTMCLNGDGRCDQITQQANNPKLAGILCSAELSANQCKPVAENGVCPEIGDAATFDPAASAGRVAEDAVPAKAPTPNVKIPGLEFAQNLKPIDNYLYLPYIGQYVSSLYNFIIGASLIAAAIMIVYGGFLYILGSTAVSVSNGKDKIYNALIGLVLVFTMSLLLNTINPALTGGMALKIKVAGREGAMSAPAEKKRIEEAATVKPTEVPVALEEAGGASTPSSQTPAPPSPETGASPASQTAPAPPKPGTVAKDNFGNYVAQGDCPSDMRKIPYSGDYEAKTKKHVNSFCMDTYEAPNVAGAKPIRGANEWEAEWYCQDQGKRLCNYSEWVRACLGPKGENTYGYVGDFVEGQIKDAGKTQQFHDNATDKDMTLNRGVTTNTGKPAAPCNYDTNTPGNWKGYENVIQPFNGVYKTNRKKELSILNPKNPLLTDPEAKIPVGKSGQCPKIGCSFKEAYEKFQAELKQVDGSEPSGARQNCFTPEGVYDLTANVSEMTVKDSAAEMAIDKRVALPSQPKSYVWAGFNWNPIPHLASINARPTCGYTSGGAHGAGDDWRDYINGFRCCMNLQETP